LQDAALNAIDQWAGLDWKKHIAFVNNHPFVGVALTIGYNMIRWPIFVIPLALALIGDYRRMQEFTLAFGMALTVTTLISAVVPAYGFYHLLGPAIADYPHLNPLAFVASAQELPVVRDGSLRQLDLLKLTGLVTFPSFHAASALLYAWALWPVRWMRTIGLISNGLMLASTPVLGGHYVVDVFAGLAVAAAAIAGARLMSQCLARLQSGKPRTTLRAWQPRQQRPTLSTS
jgi:membrane-associated phospholipid phosphatase